MSIDAAAEKIRLVQRALAAQQLRALEQHTGAKSERFENRARRDLLVAFDENVGDSRFPFWIDVEREVGAAGCTVDLQGGVDHGVGVALVPERLLKKNTARIEPDHVERRILSNHDALRDFTIRENFLLLIDRDVRHDRR